jgi:hypothetical protein
MEFKRMTVKEIDRHCRKYGAEIADLKVKLECLREHRDEVVAGLLRESGIFSRTKWAFRGINIQNAARGICGASGAAELLKKHYKDMIDAWSKASEEQVGRLKALVLEGKGKNKIVLRISSFGDIHIVFPNLSIMRKFIETHRLDGTYEAGLKKHVDEADE